MTDSDLPRQDPARPNTEQGLYRKYEVYRTDRTDAGPGCKHWKCDHFVIDVTHDEFARAALTGYADACEATHPQLAADMRSRYGLATSSATAELVPAAAPVSAAVAAPTGARDEGQSLVHPAAPGSSMPSAAPLSEPCALDQGARPVRMLTDGIYEQHLRGVLEAIQDYLPPDGIDAQAALNRIIALVDPWPVKEAQ